MAVAACVAFTVTDPAPVKVSVELEIVAILAGELDTVYVTAPVDADVVLTVNGVAPDVFVGIDVNASVGVAGLTVSS